jgi:osmotically-inducible protein OsmY
MGVVERQNMNVAHPLRSDRQIQEAVQDEIAWAPDVDAAGIGVAIEDGTVSLSGEVDSYAERLAAKRAALRVRGVTTLIDNLVVRPKFSWSASDTDVAREVAHALEVSSNIPDTVKAEIRDHNVILSGRADWDFQRQAAVRAVQYLRGVRSVSSTITLTQRPAPDAAETTERIKDAFTRNALLDASAIEVKVIGSEVTITGSVQSWAEKNQAGKAAWSSPHVTEVHNRISVRGY